jgi:hypothetical protein
MTALFRPSIFTSAGSSALRPVAKVSADNIRGRMFAEIGADLIDGPDSKRKERGNGSLSKTDGDRYLRG